jgi:type I protein arginine methyltransferase
VYSLSGYGDMVADRIRVQAYSEALRRAVRPGSVVVEIGTGPGVFAVLACQLGASRVYAIEPDPIIQVAREIAAANHCADKIEFIEDVSTRVELPARADVVFSDMRGILPLFTQNIPSIADARRRSLAPGGMLIPRKDTVWFAVVETPERYSRFVECWEKNVLGEDLSPARRLAVNECQKARFTPEQLLTKPQLWCTLNYATVEDVNFHGTLNWASEREGTGHGLLAWFEADLADGIGFSNAPGEPEAIYGSSFFPWIEPVPLAVGQSICVHLDANLVEDDYIWRWTTQVSSLDGSGMAARFEQSQLGSAVLSPAKLRRSASDYVPQLSEEGRIRRRALELMDGRASLEEIARQLTAEFPGNFARWQRALSYAANTASHNSR